MFFEIMGEFVKAFSQTETLIRWDIFRHYPRKIAEEIDGLTESLDVLCLLDSYCILLKKKKEDQILAKTIEIKSDFHKINTKRNKIIHRCGFHEYKIEELKMLIQSCIDFRGKIMGSDKHEFEWMSTETTPS